MKIDVASRNYPCPSLTTLTLLYTFTGTDVHRYLWIDNTQCKGDTSEATKYRDKVAGAIYAKDDSFKFTTSIDTPGNYTPCLVANNSVSNQEYTLPFPIVVQVNDFVSDNSLFLPKIFSM